MKSFSRKYGKTAEIISKVAVALSLTNGFEQPEFWFCCLSSLNSLSNLFSQNKISLC